MGGPARWRRSMRSLQARRSSRRSSPCRPAGLHPFRSVRSPQGLCRGARLAVLPPGGLDQVFFAGQPTEGVDTLMKSARPRRNVSREGAGTHLSGCRLGHRGVGSGGISVSGIVRKHPFFGGLLSDSGHPRRSRAREKQALAKGESECRARFARLSESSRFGRRVRFRASQGFGRPITARRLPQAPARGCARLRSCQGPASGKVTHAAACCSGRSACRASGVTGDRPRKCRRAGRSRAGGKRRAGHRPLRTAPHRPGPYR